MTDVTANALAALVFGGLGLALFWIICVILGGEPIDKPPER